MCIDTISLPDVSQYGDMYIDILLHLYICTCGLCMYVL